VQWRWSESLWQEKGVVYCHVAKDRFLWYNFLFEQIRRTAVHGHPQLSLRRRLPKRINFDVFDRCFFAKLCKVVPSCKVETRACESYAIALSGASRLRFCPGPRVNLIRPCQSGLSFLSFAKKRLIASAVVPKLVRVVTQIKVAITSYYPQYFAVSAHNIEQQCGFGSALPLKNRILPPGGNLPSVWEPLC